MLNMATALSNGTEIDAVRLSFVTWLFEQEQEQQAKIAMYRRYYLGDHDTQLTDRQAAYLELDPDTEFNLNYCPIPVDTLAERLIVTGFDTDDQAVVVEPVPADSDDDKEAALTQGEIFWDWWLANDFDQRQNIIHRASARDGDSYVITEWDEENDRPIFSFEEACTNGVGVKVHYSQERNSVVDFASKRWVIELGSEAGKLRRMNLYYPNRVEKYFSNSDVVGGTWHKLKEDDGIWPIWWTDTGKEEGEPLGIPVQRFANNDQGNGDSISELAPVVPMQNALNKTMIDLLATADTEAFRMITATGFNASSLDTGPGAVLWTTSPEGKFGAIPGADLSPMANLVDTMALQIARVSRTPLTAFQMAGGGGNVTSGETLKQLEAGLVAKATERQTTFGAAWENVMGMARKLSNAFGTIKMDEGVQIATIWKDAQTTDEKALLESLQLKRALGIPIEVLWQEAGYTAAQIEAMKDTDDFRSTQAGRAILLNDVASLEAADAA